MSSIPSDTTWSVDDLLDTPANPSLRHKAIRRRIVLARRSARLRPSTATPTPDDKAIESDARVAMAESSKIPTVAERVRRYQELRCDAQSQGKRVKDRLLLVRLKEDEKQLAGEIQLARHRLQKTPRYVDKAGDQPTNWPIHHRLLVPVLLSASLFCVVLGYNATRFFVENSGQFSPETSWVVGAGAVLAVLGIEVYGSCCLRTLEAKRRFLTQLLVAASSCWACWIISVSYAGRKIFETAALGSTTETDDGSALLIGQLQLFTQVAGEVLTGASALNAVTYLFDAHANPRTVETPAFRTARTELEGVLRIEGEAQTARFELEGHVTEQDALVNASCDNALRVFERWLRKFLRDDLLGNEK